MTIRIPAPGPLRWLAYLLLAAATSSCGSNTAPADRTAPLDTTTPVPIDAPPSSLPPMTYKGLPLALVERRAPVVTAVDGVVGVVCIGMSNANQECGRLAAAIAPGGPWAGEVTPAVRFLNCAVGGHAIERWIDPAYDAALWQRCVSSVLPGRDVRPAQVRVIVHKAANQFGLAAGGGALPLYPAAASNFHRFVTHLDAFSGRVRTWFPGVQAVYTSSRSYGGYSSRPDRGEPQAYEEGHALNQWLARHERVDGVWYGWWAYLWAPDCATGVRNGRGVCYERTDFSADALHPTAQGEIKIARLMHDRLREEAWYRR